MSSSPSKKAKTTTSTSGSSDMNSPAYKTDKPLFITVIGGGNSSPIFAGLAATAGHQVAVLTRQPKRWAKQVGLTNEDPLYLHGTESLYGEVELVTDDPAQCIPQSDLIFIAGIPIHHNPAILQQIKPHLRKDKIVHIGTVCAYGGFNWIANKELGSDIPYSLFGTQLIPWTCGTITYGETGVVFGAKRLLRIATEGGQDKHGLKQILGGILRMPFLTDTDFLASTMWPNNTSLHPPILYGLFKNWDGKTGYPKKELPVYIYKDLRTGSSEALVTLDRELCSIVAALRSVYPQNENLKLDFSLKHCIMENYGDQVLNSYSTVTCVMCNKAFWKHKIPYTDIDTDHSVPTLKHKFFETDLPYGLVTFKDIALMASVPTPLIDAIIDWNQRLIGKEYMVNGKLTGKDIDECVVPSRMGLNLRTLA